MAFLTKKVLSTFFIFVALMFTMPCSCAAEMAHRIRLKDNNGNEYVVLNPQFSNGMKVCSNGLRFQKGQTSFVFKWKDIKKARNNGKTWEIIFQNDMTDNFEIGISMDILLGEIEQYGSLGEFQIFTRNVSEILVEKIQNLPISEKNGDDSRKIVEILMTNGELITGDFSQKYIYLESGKGLVKVDTNKIAEIKIFNNREN